MRSIMLCNSVSCAQSVYSQEVWAELKNKAGLDAVVYTKEDVLSNPSSFKDVDYIFSTWGMPQMTEEEIRTLLPNVQCLFYAAGSVQYFARPFLNCGIKVFSAWAANAVPVAEYTVAQIILANTGYFHASTLMRSGHTEMAQAMHSEFPGNYDVSVGIIGVGMIGKKVIELLKNYRINVMAYSPSLTEEKADVLGVKRSTIEEIFANCQVISNHLANLPATVGILNKAHFSSMRPYATFINTGRGAQVVEDDLVNVLRERSDLFAVLDVTFPEPPVEGHAFYSLPNCILTPHIAGSLGNEVHRMAEYMLTEFKHHIHGEPYSYEVTLQLLEHMA